MLNTTIATIMVAMDNISQHAITTAQTAWGEAAQFWGDLISSHPIAVEAAGLYWAEMKMLRGELDRYTITESS